MNKLSLLFLLTSLTANGAAKIQDADIKSNAAIQLSKLAALSNNSVVVTDGSGVLTQHAQITASRALISDSNGEPTHSATTSTELGFVSGVTSAIQTQINNISGAATSVGTFGSTPNTAGQSLSGNILTMQPADGTRPGGVSIAAQTFAGNKTFNDNVIATVIAGPNTGGTVWPNNFLLKDNNGGISVNWNSYILADASNVTAIDWGNRALKNTSGNTIFSWGTALSANSNKISSVTDPTSAQDAATKNYVDTQLLQLNPAAAVAAASTANIAGTYTNAVGGVCIGDTFQVTATTAFAPDSVTLTVGQRFLMKDQTSSFQDGVWTLTTAANVGVLGALLTRALDFDSSADINAGQIIPVSGGTVNAGSSWYQTANNTTCNSSTQTWTQFQKAISAYTSSTLTNTHVLVGNSSNVATDVAVSGDATMANTGALTIANTAVTGAKIASATVANSNLANMVNSTIKCNVSGGSAAPSDCTGGQVGTVIGALLSSNNLSDVTAATARANLGLTSAAIAAVPATNGAVLTGNGTTWAGSTVPVPACSAISASSIDWSLSNCFTKTLSANTTFTFANRVAGQTIVIRLRNNGFNYTFPQTNVTGGSVLWSGSTIPAATAGAKSDIITVFFDGTEMYGNPVANFGTY